jgi:hypothetical protein
MPLSPEHSSPLQQPAYPGRLVRQHCSYVILNTNQPDTTRLLGTHELTLVESYPNQFRTSLSCEAFSAQYNVGKRIRFSPCELDARSSHKNGQLNQLG